jgi:tRNA A-37 threonylcarbamoyl transferase component Bud32
MKPQQPQQFGRYRVVGSLGMGAMGCVYEGYDPHIERRVAIKTIRLEQLSPEMEAEFEARFRSEVRAAGRLHHPNIVALHDAGRDEGVAYTVMEFVEGQDLKRHLDGGAVYSVESALLLVQQLLAALAAAHAQGVIHRDVKPANVMLTAGGQVKLTDFGVARLLDSGDATRTRGMIVGTVKYASPEQLSGLPLDGRSDLFSVGVLLYRLLANQHPFDGPNELAVMQKVASEMPPPPSSINPAVPAALDAVVLKALAKAPEGRYADAAEFSAALRPFSTAPSAFEPGTLPGSSSGSAPNRTRPLSTDETVVAGASAPAKRGIKWALVGGGAVALAAAAYVWMTRPSSDPRVATGPVPAVGGASSAVRKAAAGSGQTLPVSARGVPAPAGLLDGVWAGHFACSELLTPSVAKNRGAFKAEVVIQITGRTIAWTRRSGATLETLAGQLSADGHWSAEGGGENAERKDRWATVGTGVVDRKVSPPKLDGEVQILSPDKSKLHRKCTLTALRQTS